MKKSTAEVRPYAPPFGIVATQSNHEISVAMLQAAHIARNYRVTPSRARLLADLVFGGPGK